MINWIDITSQVPTNRKKVLVWGYCTVIGISINSSVLLGFSRYNTRSNTFDTEKPSMFSNRHVTHWAEIGGPTSE